MSNYHNNDIIEKKDATGYTGRIGGREDLPAARPQAAPMFPYLSSILESFLAKLPIIDLVQFQTNFNEYIDYLMERERDVKEDRAEYGMGGGKTRKLKKRYKKVKSTHKHRLYKRRTQKHRRHRKH